MDRVFPRLPVLIGRDVFPTECRLDEPEVSKLHASVDIRGGQILLKDASSRNGTHIGGRRVEPNQWLALGPSENPVEIRIGDWQLQLVGQRVETEGSGLRDATGAWNEGGGGPQFPKTAVLDAVSLPPQASRDNSSGGMPTPGSALRDSAPPPPMRAMGEGHATYNMQDPLIELVPMFAKLTELTRDLRDRVVRKLELTPPQARAYVCNKLATSFPMMATEPEFVAVLQRYGWVAPPGSGPGGASPTARTSQQALDDLARAYLGQDRYLATPAEVIAFRDKLRATLDELLVGYVPLLQGLERFEDQIALQQGRQGGNTRGAADLARVLLDWREQSGEPLQRLRGNFADLMMHQVALLNAVMRGVRVLLAELSPLAIEKAASRDVTKAGWFSRLFSRSNPWALYKSRHADLADEENERFRLIFGPEFADEYKQFVREAHDPAQQRR